MTETALIGIVVLVSLWILWKTRKIIWFCVLFVVALIFFFGLNMGIDILSDEEPVIGFLILALGATWAAFKFAKKRV